MHPLFTEIIAQQRIKDMLAAAERQRGARPADQRIKAKVRRAWFRRRAKLESAPLRRAQPSRTRSTAAPDQRVSSQGTRGQLHIS